MMPLTRLFDMLIALSFVSNSLAIVTVAAYSLLPRIAGRNIHRSA